MAETYVVRVDLDRLRTRCSISEHRQYSEDEVRLWLIRYGFYPRVDGLYLAEEEVLRRLEPDEVLDAQLIDPVLQ